MPTSNDRPNILFILTDQQRADTIRALGNPIIKTPNLDRLCGEGTAFTSAYTPSPVCVAARCSILHGQYPHNTGCYDNGFDMPEDRATYADVLSSAGYRTHAIGKCHFQPDLQSLRGFETRDRQEEFAPTPGDDDYLVFLHENGYDYVTDPHGARGAMYYVPQISPMPAHLHPTHWVGDRAVDFIETNTGDRPWMLKASFIHPHPPFMPPAPWHKLYRGPQMPLPHVPPDSDALQLHINRLQNRRKFRGHGVDQDLTRTTKAFYYACISFIDQQVGRMFAGLEATGCLDNTLILFASDHGELMGDYDSHGKRSMHDACARIPLIARMPGRFGASEICNRPANLVDLAPTMLAAAGVSFDTHQPDGEDLVGIADGTSARDHVLSQYQSEGDAVYMRLSERWKYVYSAPDQRELLFDRQMDPAETRDRAGTTYSQKALDDQRAQLVNRLRGDGDESGIDGDGWKEFPKQEMPDNPDAGLRFVDHGWANRNIPGYTDID